jgi:hypothetical protein
MLLLLLLLMVVVVLVCQWRTAAQDVFTLGHSTCSVPSYSTT